MYTISNFEIAAGAATVFDQVDTGLFVSDELGLVVDTVAGTVVRCYKRSSRLLTATNSSGYNYVTIGGKQIGQHTLICMLATGLAPVTVDGKAFIANHKDGNGLNNKSSNLEWVTYKENSLHAEGLKLLRAAGYADKAGHLPAPLSINDIEVLGDGHFIVKWTSPTGEVVTLAR